MIINCHIDSEKFKRKPDITEIGLISNRIIHKNKKASLEDVISGLSEGKTVLPFNFLTNKRSRQNFSSTNILLLDFDNKDSDNIFTIRDCLDLDFTAKNACFLYETFNSTKEVPKFRLGFVLDFYITSEKEFKGYYNQLLEVYPQADVACNDCARLFFGGKNLQELSTLNRLSKRDLIEVEDNLNSESYYRNSPQINIHLLNAYRNLDKVYLKEFFGDFKGMFSKSYSKDYEFLQDFIKINMYELYSLPTNTFKCVLTEEDNPSCSIMTLPNGDYIYKRFSKGNKYTLNNFQLLKNLSNKSYNECVTFLMEILEVEILERSVKDKFIKDLEKVIIDKENFSNTCTLLKRYASPIKDILFVMFNEPMIIDKGIEFISVNNIYKLAEYVYGVSENNSVRLDTIKKKISNILYALTYLGIIKNLKDEEINPQLYYQIKNRQYDRNNSNRSNVYRLNYRKDFKQIEAKAERLVSNKISVFKLTSDMIIALDDTDTYKEICVQSEKEKVTPKLAEFKNDLYKYIKAQASEKDCRFITLSSLKAYFIDNNLASKKMLKTHLIPQLIMLKDNFEYTICYSSKALGEELNVDFGNSRKQIILFNIS